MVVLEREQRVKHRQADPPVVGEPAEVESGLRIDRQQFGRLELELACQCCVRSLRSGLVVASRRSASRPTSGCSGSRRPAAASSRQVPDQAPIAALSSSDRAQSSPGASGISIPSSRLGALVHEPVVDHELNPRRRQQVQKRCGLKFVARHQARLATRGFGLSRLAVSGNTCSKGTPAKPPSAGPWPGNGDRWKCRRPCALRRTQGKVGGISLRSRGGSSVSWRFSRSRSES